MHKSKYYRAPKPSTLPQRHSSKPQPQWTTDFSDPDKYKLSEAEMIQRKAALQSKNRQRGRQALEERRRKLQMGIVDEDTKKVYETALASKKIDLNPSVRRNLSQMIQYERQKMQQFRQERELETDSDGNQDFQKEIKRTGNFIKKLQKTKKENNIEKALEILSADQNRECFYESTKQDKVSSKMISFKQSDIIEDSQNCQQSLSNIEQTIKFMEQKLFNPNWKKQTHAQEDNHQKNTQKMPENNFLVSVSESEDSQQISYQEFLVQKSQEALPPNYSTNTKINLNHDLEEDDECLSTIRRMKQMIQSRGQLFNPEPYQLKQNFNSTNEDRFRGFSTIQKMSEGDAEVDFSLTMNEDDPSFKVEQPMPTHLPTASNWQSLDNYEQLKKNLFDQVDRLQNCGSESHLSFSKNDFDDQIEERPQPPPQPQPKKVKSKKSSQPLNSEFEQIKNLIEGTKTNVQKIKVEPIGISKGNNMMGFDFRGSINIKRNVVPQP